MFKSLFAQIVELIKAFRVALENKLHKTSPNANAVIQAIQDYVKLSGGKSALCYYMEKESGLSPAQFSLWADNKSAFFVAWPEGSGNSVFPVPHPNVGGASESCEAYIDCGYGNYLEGAYGALRIKLCDYLIKEFKGL
jgi:hypothetical protein